MTELRQTEVPQAVFSGVRHQDSTTADRSSKTCLTAMVVLILLVEVVRKPGSVPELSYLFPGNSHSSGYAVTDTLKQPTRRHGRATLNAPLFGLAPDGVYLASGVAAKPGELLPHPFTLTCRGRRTSLCGTFPWGHPRWTLSSVTPYGARTFLHRTSRQRLSELLQPNQRRGASLIPGRSATP